MILWFAATAFVAVWAVFKDPAIDYRLVMVGALVPDAIDVWTGGRWIGHTVLLAIVVLTAAMLGTRSRRRLRRRLLALPIGMFLHLVFDGVWADRATFWWPAFGASFDGELPTISRGEASVLLELVGVALLIWVWQRFRFGEPERRRYFLRTGRVGRDLADRPRW
jgi:hypothetical protein